MTESDLHEETVQAVTEDPPPQTAAAPEAAPVERPSRKRSNFGLSVTALLLAFVLGLLIGYIARPFTDSLADGNVAASVVTTQEATEETESTSAPEEQAVIGDDVTESDTANAGATVPPLITPTPDRSAEIAAAILPNVRHFVGDEDAPVTLIEFSDFQ